MSLLAGICTNLAVRNRIRLHHCWWFVPFVLERCLALTNSRLGGTAGLTLATRLSETNATVLVLEAGPAPDQYASYLVPLEFEFVLSKKHGHWTRLGLTLL